MDPWELKVRKILNDNIESCKYYELAHEKKTLNYKLIYSIVTSITTVIMFVNFILSTLVSSNIVGHRSTIIVVAIFSAIIGGNNVFSKYCFDPAERMTQHNECKNKYKHLISNINIELNFGVQDREKSENFTKQICKEMLEIETSPNVPSIHSKKYLKEKRELQKSIINEVVTNNSPDIEHGTAEQKDMSDNTVDFRQVILNTGIVGLSEDENIDFDILYNNSALQSILDFQRGRFDK